jgi:hypothetical protein
MKNPRGKKPAAAETCLVQKNKLLGTCDAVTKNMQDSQNVMINVVKKK